MPVIETIKGVAVDAATLAGKGYLTNTTMSDTTVLPYFMAVARAYYQASGDARDAASTMLSGSSVTSNTVGIGTKSFTASTGKGWQPGSTLVAFSSATPGNAMYGRVTSYNSATGALVLEVPAASFAGTGTATDWILVPGGVIGPTGATGSLWLSGAGVPSAGLGRDADLYLRTNGEVYLKTAGAWALTQSIIGPQGIQGIQGITGSGSNIHASQAGVGITAEPRSRINLIGATVADNAGADRIDITVVIPAAPTVTALAAFHLGVY